MSSRVSPSCKSLNNSGWTAISILAERPILIICHNKPKIKCGRPSAKSTEPILTTLQPIALHELITTLLFSVIWNWFNGFPFFG